MLKNDAESYTSWFRFWLILFASSSATPNPDVICLNMPCCLIHALWSIPSAFSTVLAYFNAASVFSPIVTANKFMFSIYEFAVSVSSVNIRLILLVKNRIVVILPCHVRKNCMMLPPPCLANRLVAPVALSISLMYRWILGGIASNPRPTLSMTLPSGVITDVSSCI